MKITFKERPFHFKVLTFGLACSFLMCIGLLSNQVHAQIQNHERPTGENYISVLSLLQDELSYLNEELDQHQGSVDGLHTSELITFYQQVHDEFESSTDIYRSVATGLHGLYFNSDPASNFFQNLFNEDFLPSSDQTGTPQVQEDPSPGSGSGSNSLIYEDDDILFSYNYVLNEFKAIIDAIELTTGDTSDFENFLIHIREAR